MALETKNNEEENIVRLAALLITL